MSPSRQADRLIRGGEMSSSCNGGETSSFRQADRGVMSSSHNGGEMSSFRQAVRLIRGCEMSSSHKAVRLFSSLVVIQTKNINHSF